MSTPAARAQFICTTNNGAITITGYTGADEVVIIPFALNGLLVTSIGAQAFFGNESLTSISIPGSVTTIGNAAFFQCIELTNAPLPTNIVSVGSQAFFDTRLSTLTLPRSLATIGNGAFGATYITDVFIPAGVTNIGPAPFEECHELPAINVDANNLFYSSVNGFLYDKSQTALIEAPGALGGDYSIAGGVSSIGQAAFAFCYGLDSLTIPSSVTNIGSFACYACPSLESINVAAGNPNYSSIDGVLFNQGQNTLLEFPSGRGGSYTIPASAGSIGPGAFEGSALIASVTIPDNVTNIGLDAFSECTGLTNAFIADGTLSLGQYVFYYCTSLRDVTLPNTITNIPYYAFGYCSSLGSVTIPASVTFLDTPAFAFCTALTNVYFEGNAPEQSSGFLNDPNATAYYLPGTSGWTATIDNLPAVMLNPPVPAGFLQMNILPAAAIAAGVQWQEDGGVPQLNGATVLGLSVGNHAVTFSALSGWTTPAPQTIAIAPNTTNMALAVYVPLGQSYSSPFFFSLNPDNTATITGYVGTNTALNIPATINGLTVTKIGEAAFEGLTNLVSVTCGPDVTSIQANAFAGCSNLADLYFQGAAPGTDATAFAQDSIATAFYTPGATGWGATLAGLPTAPSLPGSLYVTLSPEGADIAGAGWRLDDGDMETNQILLTNLPPGNHTISFTPARGWTTPASQTISVNAHSSTTVLGVYAPQHIYYQEPFEYVLNADETISIVGCYDSPSVLNIPPFLDGRAVTSIGDLALVGQTALASVIIPETVTGIGQSAFQDCFSLTEISVPSTVTNIGDAAFEACYSLPGITLPPNITNLGNSVFYDTGLMNVDLPVGLVRIGEHAFDSSALMNVTIPDTVTSIAPFAFYNCEELDALTLPDSVTNIGTDAFEFCQGLLSLAIPASVSSIGNGAFEFCQSVTAITVDSNNPAYASVTGILFNKSVTSLLLCPNAKTGKYKIPNGVTNIATAAFAGCDFLLQITLPNSLQSIGDMAFLNCAIFTETIPASVTSIGAAPFADAPNLTAINVSPANPAYASVAGVLFDKKLNTLIQYPAYNSQPSYVVPHTVVQLGEYAFSGADFLQIIYFPGNAPGADATVFADVVSGELLDTTAYYLANTSGWGPVFAGIPATPWLPATGALQVGITPSDAAILGAQWQLDGGVSNASGVVAANLSTGSHIVSFDDLPGWYAPAPQTVLIRNNVTKTITGNYRPLPPNSAALLLQTNGYGTIQHAPWGFGPELVMGKNYTVTAVAKPGNFFVNWVVTGSQNFVSAKPALAFNMTTDLVVQVNFVTNYFTGAQGNFHGLFAPADNPRGQGDSGSFTLNVTSGRVVSGNLSLSGNMIPFSGTFDANGDAILVTKPAHGIASLTINLTLDFTRQTVSGTLGNNAFTAALNGYHDGFNSSHPATGFAGQYNMVIPGTNDPTAGPFGFSYFTVSVNNLGTVALAGSLADGTPVSQSSVISKNGWWPFYVNLYGGNGSLWSWNLFTNQTVVSFTGLSWINKTNSAGAAVYHSGFTNQQATFLASAYVRSAALPPGLPLALQDANDLFSISKFTGNTNKLVLHTNITTGVISGSFANPLNPKQILKINGVILPNQGQAEGYFLEGSQSGQFILGPP